MQHCYVAPWSKGLAETARCVVHAALAQVVLHKTVHGTALTFANPHYVCQSHLEFYAEAAAAAVWVDGQAILQQNQTVTPSAAPDQQVKHYWPRYAVYR